MPPHGYQDHSGIVFCLECNGTNGGHYQTCSRYGGSKPRYPEPENKILSERQQTHGDYARSATLTNRLKREFRSLVGVGLSAPQQEAIEMILFKIARIACGNPNHPDHWRDIIGYARLVLNELEGAK